MCLVTARLPGAPVIVVAAVLPNATVLPSATAFKVTVIGPATGIIAAGVTTPILIALVVEPPSIAATARVLAPGLFLVAAALLIDCAVAFLLIWLLLARRDLLLEQAPHVVQALRRNGAGDCRTDDSRYQEVSHRILQI